MARPRSRDLGLPIGTLEPGPLDAITDVGGVLRAGVTVVVPHDGFEPLFAGCHRLNGNGELTGLEWVRESGCLTTPIGLTNTHSVGVVRDALVEAEVLRYDTGEMFWSLPVVGETWDGSLNDINGFHVRAEHVHEALDRAAGGPVEEGGVGSGTGMICHGFKGGLGTASRRAGAWTVGVLVQANHGSRERLAQRCALGIARTGGAGEHSSGDLVLAFSTARQGVPAGEVAVPREPDTIPITMLVDAHLDPLFYAAIEATEAAIVNALLAGETMTGRDGITAHPLTAERLLDAIERVRAS